MAHRIRRESASPLRAKKKVRLKRAMFQKLRTNRYAKPVAVKTVLWWNYRKCAAYRACPSVRPQDRAKRTPQDVQYAGASYSGFSQADKEFVES